ncbi:MAG: VanZ family protein [Ignavibacteria bacterium]|jgi:VanZ family protein
MQLDLLLTRLYNRLAKNKIIYVYLPLVIYWLSLILFTSIPINVKKSFEHQDKLNHLIAFAGLSVLLQLTLHFQGNFEKINKRHATFTIIIASIYGALNEITQLFIPGRFGDIFDWVADLIGILIGVFITSYFIKQADKNSIKLNG